MLRLQLMSSFCHGIYIAWHFLAMLVFMTYNVGCCVVVVIGAPLTEPLAFWLTQYCCPGIAVGHFIFTACGLTRTMGHLDVQVTLLSCAS